MCAKADRNPIVFVTMLVVTALAAHAAWACTTDDDCDDGEQCTADTCDPVLGCISDPVSGVCVDGARAACPAPTVQALGSRYLEVTTPAEGPRDYAIHVTGVDQDVSCVSGYVKRSLSDPKYGVLQGLPEYRPSGPGGWGTVHVYGGTVDDRGTPETDDDRYYMIIGGRTYDVSGDCDPKSPGTSLSDPATVTTWTAGDVNNDGVVDIRDLVAAVSGFQGNFNVHPSCPDCYPACPPCTSDAECWCYSPHQECLTETGLCRLITIENVDVTGDADCEPNQRVSILDIVEILTFFQRFPDPCNPHCPP